VRATLGSPHEAIVRRGGLVARAIDAPNYPVAFIGDGGFGKSVLVGEIADVSTTRELVLVTCAALDGTDQLQGADQIDDALGRQSSGLHISLSEVLDAFDARPFLVIDTLDILLREETAPAIGDLLSRWSHRADLVVTCRSREWYDLVSARQPVFAAHDMPSLDSAEVLVWSARFTTHDAVSLDAADSFAVSLAAALCDPKSLKVLGVPLRLAMATRLYAPKGALPADLTATQLYRSYWAERVSTGRDGRKNTRLVKAIEDAALDVASGVWHQSVERFAEDLRYSGDAEATNALISEGILCEVGLRIHFFHQTFAEFAVARYLAAAGEASDFVRLREGLSAQRSGYWGIASHLILEELTEGRFEAVVDHIPIDSIEGVRVVLDGLLARTEHGLVLERLNQLVEQSPDHVAAASDILEAAPRRHVDAVAGTLCQLADIGSGDLTAVVRAVAALVRRMPADSATAVFDAILSSLDARELRGDGLIASESRRLIDAVFPADTIVNAALLGTAVAHYTRLPAPGRLATIRAAQRCEDTRSRNLLVSQAMRREVPSGSVDDLAELVISEFEEPNTRGLRGWRNWSDVVSAPLPPRWDAVQVRVVAHLARDPLVRNELIAEAITPRIGARRDVLINALRFVAGDQPEQFANALAEWGLPNDRPTANAYAQLALELQSTLNEPTRSALLRQLHAITELEPRRVWAAVLKLSARDSKALALAIDDLATAASRSEAPYTWRATVEAACNGLYQVVSPSDLAAQMDRLRPLWELVGGIGNAQIGKALGLLAAVSASARADFDDLIDSDRKGAQRAGIRSLLDARDRWPEDAWSQALSWRVALMRVRSDGAAINLIGALVSDIVDERWTSTETETAVNRLVKALDLRDDPQVSRKLVALLAAASHAGTSSSKPQPIQVELVLARLLREIGAGTVAADPLRAAALYPQYVATITDIAMAILGTPRSAVIVEELVARVDTAAFGSHARKSLELALGSVLRKVPSWWSTLEGLWPGVPAANRGALADLALSGLVAEREVVAERLARRPDCPPDVAADILRRLRN
jgi:hypothetical protein